LDYAPLDLIAISHLIVNIPCICYTPKIMLNTSEKPPLRTLPLTIAVISMIVIFSLTLPASVLGGFESGDKIKQVGAFHKRANALALSEEIRKSGKHSFIIEKTVKGRKFYAVMEPARNMDAIGLEPGYEQAGAFLDRQNAETMIISLRQQGAITSHCMKKQDGNIYYIVYKKTGSEGSSPCTSVPAMVSKEQDSSPLMKTDLPVTGMVNANGAKDARAHGGTEGQAVTKAAASDTPSGPVEETAEAAALAGAGEKVTGSDKPDTEGQAEPLAGSLTPRPPLTEAPPGFILDSSPIVPIEDNEHFYLKSEAVVFTDKNQFGTWYGRFEEFGGGTVNGQSNKWYVVRLRGGITGYVQKVASVQYTLPYEEDAY